MLAVKVTLLLAACALVLLGNLSVERETPTTEIEAISAVGWRIVAIMLICTGFIIVTLVFLVGGLGQ